MTKLLVVGAGPAGVAAALMASSLGMRTTLIEAGQVGEKLQAIGALENVPGGWSKGAELAEGLATDVERLQAGGRCALVHGQVERIVGTDDQVEVVLASGGTLVGNAAVVATGVHSLRTQDVDWIDASAELTLPPLWRTSAGELEAARHTVVLGGDRPLGTWLRAHPHAAVELEVLYPAVDAYKIAEVAEDPRVRAYEIEHVVAQTSVDGVHLTVEQTVGGLLTVTADVVLGNMGSKPAVPDGDLVRGPDGYCPPTVQHPRILIAGDLRSARFQRIASAQGSGAEAVLAHYYRAVDAPN
ncbi:FAD-dependent oxidoreductase [Streptomyces armeniacus]|uniref:FAD-dependent oxidoreductase n=1 Tax=Streptomyces armeniacus TaxID=83291 RepID=UPI001AD7F481|nr:FAD-dependent oxidoreductase [Streptomyces armeniacus]